MKSTIPTILAGVDTHSTTHTLALLDEHGRVTDTETFNADPKGYERLIAMIGGPALCLGVGVTQVEGFFDNLPPVFGEIFAGNMVAGVFVVGLILELCLPKDPKRYETR